MKRRMSVQGTRDKGAKVFCGRLLRTLGRLGRYVGSKE